jgi:DNA-binding CsgD family transcriptional regulator
MINDVVYAMNAESNLVRLRRTLLEMLSELIPHDCSFFDLGNRESGKTVFFDAVAHRMDQKWIDLYYSEYQDIDPIFWFFSQNHALVYRLTDYVNEAIRLDSAYYNKWYAPQNVYYSMGSMVSHEGTLYGSVNLWRSKACGDFTDEDMSIMEIINRHLSLYFANRFPKGISRNPQNNYTSTLAGIYRLTPREAEIANLIYEGRSIREISAALFITEDTVKKHTTHLYAKMKVDSRMRLARVIRDHMDK